MAGTIFKLKGVKMSKLKKYKRNIFFIIKDTYKVLNIWRRCGIVIFGDVPAKCPTMFSMICYTLDDVIISESLRKMT